MVKVTVKLKDSGHAIDTPEFKLKGKETQVVEETDLVKSYRKKGIIQTELFIEPKVEEPKKKPEVPKQPEKEIPEKSETKN